MKQIFLITLLFSIFSIQHVSAQLEPVEQTAPLDRDVASYKHSTPTVFQGQIDASNSPDMNDLATAGLSGRLSLFNLALALTDPGVLSGYSAASNFIGHISDRAANVYQQVQANAIAHNDANILSRYQNCLARTAREDNNTSFELLANACSSKLPILPGHVPEANVATPDVGGTVIVDDEDHIAVFGRPN